MSLLARALTGLSRFAVRHPWITNHRTLRLLTIWDGSVYVPDLQKDLDTAVAVIALPFGSHKPEGGKSGPSNRKIAEITNGFCERIQNLFSYSQWEVPLRNINDPGLYGRVTTTAGYLEELLAVSPWLCGKKIILVAHPWHFPRAKWLLESWGMIVLIPPGIGEIPWDSPEGTQKWVKGAGLWLTRELPGRILQRLAGVPGIVGRLTYLTFKKKFGMSATYVQKPSDWL